MQGTPYIYQGQELGMTNYPFTDVSEFRDIESINAIHEWVDSGRATLEEFWPCLIFKSRDNARTPMQWDDSENAGFTTGTPWIAVNPNYKAINAKAQMGDPETYKDANLAQQVAKDHRAAQQRLRVREIIGTLTQTHIHLNDAQPHAQTSLNLVRTGSDAHAPAL